LALAVAPQDIEPLMQLLSTSSPRFRSRAAEPEHLQ